MNDKCPHCGGVLEADMVDSTPILKCKDCSTIYAIMDGNVEVFHPSKKCPNCNGQMNAVKDKTRLYYQSSDAQYYKCSRCGNDYAISGGQLNDSKFNDIRAKDADNAERSILVMAVSLIIIIGYVIYGVFFASLNLIILAILVFIFIVSGVCYYLNHDRIYSDLFIRR